MPRPLHQIGLWREKTFGQRFRISPSKHFMAQQDQKKELEQILQQADPQILSNLSKDKRNRLLNALPQVASVLIEKHSFFSGPLPPTEMLQEYNRLIPNGAERIMTMAESQSAHR
jgi:hypothetical protein